MQAAKWYTGVSREAAFFFLPPALTLPQPPALSRPDIEAGAPLARHPTLFNASLALALAHLSTVVLQPGDAGALLAADVQALEARAGERDVDAGGVEDALGGRDADGQVGVLGEAGDEEHEAVGFDLQLGEVGAAHRHQRVPRQRLLVRLQDARDPLEPVRERVAALRAPRDVRHHQARCALVED